MLKSIVFDALSLSYANSQFRPFSSQTLHNITFLFNFPLPSSTSRRSYDILTPEIQRNSTMLYCSYHAYYSTFVLELYLLGYIGFY